MIKKISLGGREIGLLAASPHKFGGFLSIAILTVTWIHCMSNVYLGLPSHYPMGFKDQEKCEGHEVCCSVDSTLNVDCSMNFSLSRLVQPKAKFY